MIWYLLYPFRGTSDPPRLPSDNLIRRAFYRHGALTARFWLLAMLASVTTGVIFAYPTVFLSDFPSGNISGLPHHVWTGSISFEARTEKQPDLEMRQVWLQGDYLAALNRSVLSNVFSIEERLFSGIQNGNSQTSGWDIQSPTMYWQGSKQKLEADPDLLRTINDYPKNISHLGLEMQPFSTFARKTIRHSALVAADAAVLTLINYHNDSIGEIWQRNIMALHAGMPESWKVGAPASNLSAQSIYEYKYQPFSFRQSWALTGAYVCMAGYVALSLRRLKAFKSRFGLVVTAITQMTTSILASFTICGLLKINLAQVPQEAYPLVVLTIGLENIFRLINAVLAYPPQMANDQRIANGLGDIGHASLASAAQNLVILWILSLFVSPGVAAFCAFASVAILFDFFYLITFFVAVLNVDMKRMELQDSLVRPRAASRPRKPPARRSWLDAVLHGGLPASTRMAGSVITITFVMALNWHFADHSISSSLRTSPWSTPSTKTYPMSLDTDGTSLAVPLVQNVTSSVGGSGRGPKTTVATNFMHIVKPGVRSFTARIYDPLVLVMAGADRKGIPPPKDTWLLTIRDIATHHFYPFSLAVVFMVAFVTVLMNFLLWDERTEPTEIELTPTEDGVLSCKTVYTSHRLDIIAVADSDCGRLFTIGLDRSAFIARKDRAGTSYDRREVDIHIFTGNSHQLEHWPLEHLQLHSASNQFSVLNRDGDVLVGNAAEATLDHITTPGSDYKPILIQWIEKPVGAGTEPCLLILTVEFELIEVLQSGGSSKRTNLSTSESNIVAAAVLEASEVQLVVLTSKGTLLVFCWNVETESWNPRLATSQELTISPATASEASLFAASGLGLITIATSEGLQLLDPNNQMSMLAVHHINMKRDSVRVMHSATMSCPSCSSTAVTHICVAYTDADTNDLILTSYMGTESELGRDSTPICLAGISEGCLKINSSFRAKHHLQDPGQWSATSSLCVTGVRRTPQTPASPASSRRLTTTSATSGLAAIRQANGSAPLRRRRGTSESSRKSTNEPEHEWEAYTFTFAGTYHSTPVKQPTSAETDTDRLSPTASSNTDPAPPLYATSLGPVAKLCANSVGVALGNTVIVVKCNSNPDAEGIDLDQGTGTKAEDARDQLMGRQVGLRRSASKGKRAVSAGGIALHMSRNRGRSG